MTGIIRCTLIFLLIFLSSGCAKKTLVALVPDPDGKVGSIIVESEAGNVIIDAPYQATTLADIKEQPAVPVDISKEKLNRMFKEALSIQPQRPLHFLLYFKRDTTLTDTSLKSLPEIIAAISDRKSQDISVVGHTDTLGSEEFNTALSHERAIAVKKLLIEKGAQENAIRTTSHGKENPLIPTGDNVFEPRNRRVEVVVR